MLQYTPFGTLQVGPVTQEIREEAIELLLSGPEGPKTIRHALPALLNSCVDMGEDDMLIKEGIRFTVKNVASFGVFTEYGLTFSCWTELSSIGTSVVQTTANGLRVQPVDEVVHPGVSRDG